MKTLVFPLTPKEMDELENNPEKYSYDEDLDIKGVLEKDFSVLERPAEIY